MGDIAHLDLYIEHRPRVDPEAERRLDVLRQALLVALLHRRPLLEEGRVVDVVEQPLCASGQYVGNTGRGTMRASSLVRSFKKTALESLRVSLIRLLKPGLH